ncbi:hypothetical protein Q8W71_26750 [Methylobacterium sp. NEAU 140]|uniref:hypothetical protein n=1 Tax=Methylobacterium sp. NEAU 140 TaxID=3064945 RepID=UPI00273323D0|nr:hypothetical protein [Methylobacterium sp. NEAU 140]MDP4026231.1 hypothetical protein [Methylobacterium sp. NEAU 140]
MAALSFPTADSVDEWLELADLYRALARQALADDTTASAAWSQAGFSLECTLKAAIMRRERLNAWPSRASRRELYTHKIADLARVLGMTIDEMHPIAPAWAVVLQWWRDDMYSLRMTRAVAISLFDAVFSDEDGAAPWIRQNFL